MPRLISRFAFVLLLALGAGSAAAAGAGSTSSGFSATSATSAESHAVAFFNGTIANALAGDTAAAQTLARLAIDAANQAISLGSADGTALGVIIAAMEGYLETGIVVVNESDASYQFTPIGVLVCTDDGVCELLSYDEFDDMISLTLGLDDEFDFTDGNWDSYGPTDGGGGDSSDGFLLGSGSLPWEDPLGDGKKRNPLEEDSRY